MHPFLRLPLHCSMLVAVVVLLTSTPTVAARLGAGLFDFAQAKAAPPTAPALVLQDFTWSNCDASLPMQLDALTETIVQGHVMFILQRFHTTVAIQSAVYSENGTYTPPDGGPNEAFNMVGGMETMLVRPAALPIAAGASNVLLSFTGIGPTKPGHYFDYMEWFDAYSTLIGCHEHAYDLVLA